MAFSAMFDALFADPNMAQDAIYTPSGGDPVSVRVLLRQPDVAADPFGSSTLSASTLVEARVSDIPDPASGDTITVAGTAYTIQGAPRRDETRSVWSMEAREG